MRQENSWTSARNGLWKGWIFFHVAFSKRKNTLQSSTLVTAIGIIGGWGVCSCCPDGRAFGFAQPWAGRTVCQSPLAVLRLSRRRAWSLWRKAFSGCSSSVSSPPDPLSAEQYVPSTLCLSHLSSRAAMPRSSLASIPWCMHVGWYRSASQTAAGAYQMEVEM